MTKMNFRQINKQSREEAEIFLTLLLDYIHELDLNNPRPSTDDETIKKYANGMINRQGDFDRHLELCYLGDILVGFIYAKVDHMGHLGFIKPEYGYIMEFYVKPQHRRKGYGKTMFQHIEELFGEHNVKRMYLTANPVIGEKFWLTMRFVFTGEVSPENGLKIKEKDVFIS